MALVCVWGAASLSCWLVLMHFEPFEILEIALRCVWGPTSNRFDCMLNAFWTVSGSWDGFEARLRSSLKRHWLLFECLLNHLKFLRLIWGAFEVQPQIVLIVFWMHFEPFEVPEMALRCVWGAASTRFSFANIWFSSIWGSIRREFYNTKLNVGYNLKCIPWVSGVQASYSPAL